MNRNDRKSTIFSLGLMVGVLLALVGPALAYGPDISHSPNISLIPAGATANATFTISGANGNSPLLAFSNVGSSTGFDTQGAPFTNTGGTNGGAAIAVASGKNIDLINGIITSPSGVGVGMDCGGGTCTVTIGGTNATTVTLGSATTAASAPGGFTTSLATAPQYQCTNAGTCAFRAASGQITFIGRVVADAAAGTAGGATTIDSQIGAAGSGATNAGGGGTINMNAGAGGAGGTTGTGGGGGAFSWSTGGGGAAGSSTGAAGAGGNWTFNLGNGGAGTASLAAGAGGSVSLTAGNGGPSNGGGGGAGGTWAQDTGASTGAVAAPTWTLFGTNGGSGTIGRSGQTVNFPGTLQINGVTIDQGATDLFLSVTDTVTAVGTTGDIWVAPAATQSAMTLRGCNTTIQIAGTGTGTLTAKLSSAANGGGTVFGTLTTPCAGTVNTVTACTINTSAVPAATTFHYAITTACMTADVQNVAGIQFSQP